MPLRERPRERLRPELPLSESPMLPRDERRLLEPRLLVLRELPELELREREEDDFLAILIAV
jgi:hypothetical protein